MNEETDNRKTEGGAPISSSELVRCPGCGHFHTVESIRMRAAPEMWEALYDLSAAAARILEDGKQTRPATFLRLQRQWRKALAVLALWHSAAERQARVKARREGEPWREARKRFLAPL